MVANPWFGAIEEFKMLSFPREEIVQGMRVLARAKIPTSSSSMPCFDRGNHCPILLCAIRY